VRSRLSFDDSSVCHVLSGCHLLRSNFRLLICVVYYGSIEIGIDITAKHSFHSM